MRLTMAIGLTEEHEALAASVRGFTERHVPAQVARAALETQERPAFWQALAAQGLTVDGTVQPVLGASLADLLVLPVSVDEGEEWVVIDAASAVISPLESLDLTRGVAAVALDEVVIPEERVLRDVPDPRGVAA